MKVIHLNTFARSGGAAIAADRICTVIADNGIQSNMLSLYAGPGSASVVEKGFGYRLRRFIEHKLGVNRVVKSDAEKRIFSFDKVGVDVCNHPLVASADVIYLHWVSHGFLSTQTMEKLCATGKPIVVSLHDMCHLTGGCHYSFDCEQYTQKCAPCPFFPNKQAASPASKQLKAKIDLFGKYDNVQVVASSRWLVGCAQRSMVFQNKSISLIPYPLDTDRFKKVDKEFARRMLGLPQDKKIICFGADGGATNPYKGWSYLQQALQKVDNSANDIEVLIFGSSPNEQLIAQVPFPVHFTGKLADEYSLLLVYNAIDVFVIPSLAEAFGQVCSEAMACGVPVVGFEVGGIPDMIDHKQTGYLAKYKDVNDLAAGINYVLHTDQYDQMSALSQAKIRQMCDQKAVAESHIKLWSKK